MHVFMRMCMCMHVCVSVCVCVHACMHVCKCDNTNPTYLRHDLSMDTLVLVSPVLHANLYFTICSNRVITDRTLFVLISDEQVQLHIC